MYHDDPVHTDPAVTQPITRYTATTELTVGQPQTIAKAVVAVTTALGTGIATAVSDGRVTWVELVLAALGAAAAGASVWAVTNDPAPVK